MGSIIGSAIEATASNINMGVNNLYNQKLTRETNEANIQMNRETNAANRELAALQNIWNVEQWNRQNAYNSPLAQIQRLMQAGLSAGAASQAIDGAGNAGSLESADLANQVAPPPMQMTPLDMQIASPVGIMRQIAAYEREKAEAKVADEKAKQEQETSKFWGSFLLNQYDVERADIDLKKQQWLHIWQEFPYTLRALKYQAQGSQYIPELRRLEVENHKANYELAMQNVRKAQQEFEWYAKLSEKEVEKMNAEIKEVLSRRTKNLAEAGVASAQQGLISQQTENAKKTGKTIDLENEAKEIANIYEKNGSPKSVAQRVGVMLAYDKISLDNLDVALQGVKQYTKAGYYWFNPDPLTRNFLYYILDEGSAESSKLGMHTIGGAREVIDAVTPPYTTKTPPEVGKRPSVGSGFR